MREEKYTDMSLTDEQLALIGITSLSEPEQYIQVKDVRYTLDEFNRIGELLLGRNLTDDQQEVLEYLKKMCPPIIQSPMVTIFSLMDDIINDNWQYKHDIKPEYMDKAENLSKVEQCEILKAFAEWGLSTEEDKG